MGGQELNSTGQPLQTTLLGDSRIAYLNAAKLEGNLGKEVGTTPSFVKKVLKLTFLINNKPLAFRRQILYIYVKTIFLKYTERCGVVMFNCYLI